MENFKDFTTRNKATQIPAGKISPGFVPHEQFHKYKWLSPKSGNDKWYYRIPSMGIHQIPDNPEFYDTLDADLSEAVKFLHKNGVPTTPSCSGHFNEKKVYEDLWVGLSESCSCIRKDGLDLINPENGKTYFYKNPNFQIPFNKSHFVNQSIQHGKMGVLGMVDASDKFYNKLMKANIPNTQTIKDGQVTLFLTSPNSESELEECWQGFTKAIM
jgi:hypothetical protein